MQIVERDADGRTVGQTVGCIVEGLHGVKRDAGGSRWRCTDESCNPIGDYAHQTAIGVQREWWQKAEQPSIGGLLPVVLAMLLTGGWIGARFHARRKNRTTAAPVHTQHRPPHAAGGMRRLARDFYAFAFGISAPVRERKYFPARDIDIMNLAS